MVCNPGRVRSQLRREIRAKVVPNVGDAWHLSLGCDLSGRDISTRFSAVTIICRLYGAFTWLLYHIVSAFRIAHSSAWSVSADELIFASLTPIRLWLRHEYCSSECLKSLANLHQTLPCRAIPNVYTGPGTVFKIVKIGSLN